MRADAALPAPDLLTPVLTEEDDFAGFARPWTPWHLLLWTFFAGPFAGAWLFGVNFVRLGARRRAVAYAAAFVAIGLLVPLAVVLLVPGVSSGWEVLDPEARTARYLARLPALVCGLLAMRAQARRHRLYLVHGGQPGRLVLHGLFAGLAGLGLSILVTGAILAAVGGA